MFRCGFDEIGSIFDEPVSCLSSTWCWCWFSWSSSSLPQSSSCDRIRARIAGERFDDDDSRRELLRTFAASIEFGRFCWIRIWFDEMIVETNLFVVESMRIGVNSKGFWGKMILKKAVRVWRWWSCSSCSWVLWICDLWFWREKLRVCLCELANSEWICDD
jgi:hypothetical protein